MLLRPLIIGAPVVLLALIAFFALHEENAFAQNSEIQDLRKEVEELRGDFLRVIAEKQQKINELEIQVKALRTAQPKTEKPATSDSALDKAISGLERYQQKAGKGELASRQVGGSNLRLMDISLDVMTTGGTSTEKDSSISLLQGGDHDPKRRGFTLNQAEIGIQGAVDPYFTAEAYLVFNEEGAEMEEAFFKTSALPAGLQVKGGFFLTEFGIINQTHPHAWDWIDQPVINTRFFGGEGTRGPGVRLSWLTPLPWFSEIYLGMQNANNDAMVSFLGSRENSGGSFDPGITTTIGGRPLIAYESENLGDFLYLARWENSFDLSSQVTTKFGFSGLFGPNNTGTDGSTKIYGADLKVKWRPANNESGWPFLLWQSEIMARDYKADTFFSTDDTITGIPSQTLHDWGFYTQILYGFKPRWAAGLRYEYATGDNDSVLVFNGRNDDPFRDTRHRISPLLAWYPSEFSRFRLQYNYDNADHLKNDAHSVWVGAEFLIGSHPAHKY